MGLQARLKAPAARFFTIRSVGLPPQLEWPFANQSDSALLGWIRPMIRRVPEGHLWCVSGADSLESLQGRSVPQGAFWDCRARRDLATTGLPESLSQGDVAPLPNHHVIQERNAYQSARAAEPARDFQIFGARLGVTGGVIVNRDDRR